MTGCVAFGAIETIGEFFELADEGSYESAMDSVTPTRAPEA